MSAWLITGHCSGGVARGTDVAKSLIGDAVPGAMTPLQTATVKVFKPVVKAHRAAARAIGSSRMEYQSAIVPAGMRVFTYAEQFATHAFANTITDRLKNGDEGGVMSCVWKIKDPHAIIADQMLIQPKIFDIVGGSSVTYTNANGHSDWASSKLSELLDWAGQKHVQRVHLVLS